MRKALDAVVAFGLIFPLFFTLGGKIYRNAIEPLYDSGGVVTAVPLPISLLVCLIVIPSLHFDRTMRPALLWAASFLLALVLGDAVTGGWSTSKLAQNAQYVIPAGALVLGFVYAGMRTLVWTWLVVLAVLIPAQIAYGYWATDILLLHHDMGLFSIYQHRQFIPVFFVGAYLLGLFTLWEDRRARFLLLFISALLPFYIGLAISTLPSALLIAGTIAFAWRQRTARWLPASTFVLIIAGALMVSGSAAAKQKYAIFSQKESGAATIIRLPFGLPYVAVPINIERRLSDWKLHGAGVIESPTTALFGHDKPMDRAIATSAHNYYLDLAYNSGLIALMPVLLLLGYTLFLLRGKLDAGTYGLAFFVLFLLLLDNNFKVTFKQPYPGILGFFLWGMLLKRLREAPPRPAGAAPGLEVGARHH